MNTAITVEGNLTADPTYRTAATRGPDTARGGPDAVLTPVTNLRIAVSDRYRDPAGAWLTTDPVFYDVAIWGTPATHAAATLRSGDRVLVHGELRLRSWTGEDGQTRHIPTITADMIGLSLRYATVVPPR